MMGGPILLGISTGEVRVPTSVRVRKGAVMKEQTCETCRQYSDSDPVIILVVSRVDISTAVTIIFLDNVQCVR